MNSHVDVYFNNIIKVHLTRYSARHAGLLHYCIEGYLFKFDAPYTGFIIELGFTEHTRDSSYVSNSIGYNTYASSILLINNGAIVPRHFLYSAYKYDVLERILPCIPTSCIIDATNYNSYYSKARSILNKELARRHKIK